MDLEVGRDFTIIKGEGEWDSIALERVREMSELGRGAEVGAIICGEGNVSRFIATSISNSDRIHRG